jgi:hypothetical protein
MTKIAGSGSGSIVRGTDPRIQIRTVSKCHRTAKLQKVIPLVSCKICLTKFVPHSHIGRYSYDTASYTGHFKMSFLVRFGIWRSFTKNLNARPR